MSNISQGNVATWAVIRAIALLCKNSCVNICGILAYLEPNKVADEVQTWFKFRPKRRQHDRE